ncbi:hypothetical protein [Cohnella sp. 56]|uniref:hypothetical protein n=1 Tax=Cohnella sp. 56 TaxID=3113722 RepID=UPI0030EA279A
MKALSFKRPAPDRQPREGSADVFIPEAPIVAAIRRPLIDEVYDYVQLISAPE